MYQVNGKEYPCCTSITMDMIGGKWKCVILYYLIEGKMRYSDLREKIPHVTERALSLQLKDLVADGLVSRTVFGQKPPLKVEYELTEIGKTLIPLLKSISDWGEKRVLKTSL